MPVTTSVIVMVVGAALLVSPLLLILFMGSDEDSRQRREALPSVYSPEVNRPGPGPLPVTCPECGSENYPWREICWNCDLELETALGDRTEPLGRTFDADRS